MFVLLHKETLFNINDLDFSLPSVVTSVLQEFEDVFPEDDGPSGLPPLGASNTRLTFILELQFPTGQLIGLILRR